MSDERPGPDPLSPRVHTRVERAAAAAVAALSPFGVATLHEAYQRQGLMHGLQPVDRERRMCGTAVTALIHAGDNLMVHAAIEQCRPGDVLVVATLSPSTHGIFGELLATLCAARGIVGLVNDAGVRDTTDIRRAGFPVWSRAVSVAGSTKHAAGWVNVPVVCAGALVEPGDVIAADADGVMVIRAQDAAAVAVAACAREEREAAIRAGYATGVGKDISAELARAGVTFVDSVANRGDAGSAGSGPTPPGIRKSTPGAVRAGS